MSGSRSSVGVSLALLFAINLVNYVDRYVVASLFPILKDEFDLSDAQLGWLAPAFLLVYTVAAPIVGLVSDRTRRKGIMASGLALWSLATAGAALAGSYATLFLTRALVGIGEATCGTLGPTWIADLVPRGGRARALTSFYVAMPVGSALGYMLGGLAGARWGWRAAFLLAGVPGLLLVAALLRLREPARGATEPTGAAVRPPTAGDYRALARTPTYLYNMAGSALFSFAVGGLSYWVPTFMVRVHGVAIDASGLSIGMITVAGGLIGVLLGGWLGDVVQARTPRGHFLVSAIGMLLGTPFAIVAFLSESVRLVYAAVFVAEVLLFLNTGPLNAVLVNVTRPEVRATAVSVHIFVIHALGDVISPPLIGRLSDVAGLRAAVMLTPAAMALAGLVLLAGARHLPADLGRLAGPKGRV